MTAVAPPTVRNVGRYALYQAIASGGMANIYLGRLLGSVGFARTVAVKRLHPYFAGDRDFASMFLDEARLAARIRHPNVVPTLDVVATHGELYLVMEYVHGESLSRLVRMAAEQGNPMPVPVVVAALSGALQGLSAAHDARSERGEPLQIIHRDVSPQNILLGLDGQARLIDFGVARAEGRLHTTHAGQVKGKIAYMSPEQLRGEDIGPSTDIYAAAVVLWEALTGHRLFSAEGDGGLVVQVLEASIETPSEALRASGDDARANAVASLDAIVMRGLSKHRDARWPSAREFARALEAASAPATGAQVSDWVETAAGSLLRERAALIAEIESSSAVDLTSGEFRAAIERGIGDDSSADAGGAPPSAPPPSVDPETVALPRHPSQEPSVRAPIFIEAALADFATEPSPPAVGRSPETWVSPVAATVTRASPPPPRPVHADLGRTLQSHAGDPELKSLLAAARGGPSVRGPVAPPSGPVVAPGEAVAPPSALPLALPLSRAPRFLLLSAVALVGVLFAALGWRFGHP